MDRIELLLVVNEKELDVARVDVDIVVDRRVVVVVGATPPQFSLSVPPDAPVGSLHRLGLAH